MKVNPDNVDNLDIFDKLSIYLKYHTIQICVKYSRINSHYDTQKWKLVFDEIPTYSFSDFISTDRKVIQDNGENWRKNGWAERHTKHYQGIYNFVERFDIFI